jgi:regulator of protease activity HflC (stomatin/prohibitin superfamily)
MRILFFVLTSSILTSCAVIGPGEVGVKQKLGKLKGGVAEEGIRVYNPFIAKYLKVPIRTNNMKVNLEIPSKEGLTIRSEMSILYHIEKEKAVEVIREIGLNYEEDLIAPVFRSALADVSARFMAKDMHTGQRAVIEKEVKERMMEVLGERGVVIESVLMKRIELPASLSSAIESKLSAEQEAQRMEFVLQREQQEAERRRIEARGVRDAQKILDEGLTDAVLKFKALETFRELSQSNNSKVIFYNGEVPLMLQPEAASD